MEAQKRNKFIGIIVLLFLFSFLIRYNNFENEPMGKGFWNAKYERWTNTEVTIHHRFVYEKYNNEPASSHKFLSYHGGGQYFSFSPAVFVVPYTFYHIFNFQSVERYLQLFNLMLQLLTAIILFLALMELLKGKKYAEWIGIAGASVYIFNTNGLHNHMNVYWSHQLFMPLFALYLYLFIKHQGILKLNHLFIFTALLAYIEWGGYLFNAGLAIYFFLKSRKVAEKAVWLKQSLTVIVATITAMLVFITHNMLTSEAGAMFSNIFARVSARGPSESFYHNLPWLFIKALLYDYGAYIAFAIVVFIAARKYMDKMDKFHIEVLILTCVPLLASIVLLEHDFVYGFGRLKYAIPIILLIGLFLPKILEHCSKRAQFITWILFGTANVYHLSMYKHIYDWMLFDQYK